MITDDEIYYFWSTFYLNRSRYKRAIDQWNEEKKYLSIHGTKEECIQWAKLNLRPILPDEQEYIKRKDWLPLDTLVGETQEILDNNIWNKTQKYILENFHPTSKNLIVQRCASQKPYIDNIAYKFTKKCQNEGLCDLVVASLDIIPIDFTIYYPFRHYDWNDAYETPELTEYAINRKTKRIIKFIDAFNYNNILIFAPGFTGDTYYKIVTEKLKENYGDSKKINFVMDEQTTKSCIDRLKGLEGLAKVRYTNMKPAHNRILELLNNNEDQIKKSKLF